MKKVSLFLGLLFGLCMSITALSCKKDKNSDESPLISISQMTGDWDVDANNDEYRIELTAKKIEAVEEIPNFITPEREIGKIYRWYTKTIQVPLFPDINQKYKESGIIYITYSEIDEENNTILTSRIDWYDKQLIVSGNLTSVGSPGDDENFIIQYNSEDKDVLTIGSKSCSRI